MARNSKKQLYEEFNRILVDKSIKNLIVDDMFNYFDLDQLQNFIDFIKEEYGIDD